MINKLREKQVSKSELEIVYEVDTLNERYAIEQLKGEVPMLRISKDAGFWVFPYIVSTKQSKGKTIIVVRKEGIKDE